VVTGVSALLIGLLTVGLATTAQATRRSGPADPGRYLTRVVVQPGQSLWSLVQAYAPDVDPRQAIAQVLELNSLSGDQLQPGQVLWMPKG
jgi:LysM repeat protein